MDILFVFKYRLSYIEKIVLCHSRIYSAKVISSTLMYLRFKSIPLMIIISRAKNDLMLFCLGACIWPTLAKSSQMNLTIRIDIV